MRLPVVLSLPALLSLLAGQWCAEAHAQLGVGMLRWQVSTDGGGTWEGGLTEVPPEQGSVQVRLLASWSSDGGMYAFAGCQFDAVVRGIDGAGPLDTVVNARRTPPMTSGSAQTIAVTRFGSQIKIDDLRDTLPPGEGPRGVFPGQIVEQFGPPPGWSRDNPVSIFEYTLVLDGSEGDRDLWLLYIAPSGGNTIDRVMRIYTSSSGAQNTPSTMTRGATVRVIPAPGALLLLAMGALGARRRWEWRAEA